jgi:hypothetical protein
LNWSKISILINNESLLQTYLFEKCGLVDYI